MSDPTPAARQPLPPPAPPLPPTRFGPLQRIIAPLGLSIGARAHDEQLQRPGNHAFRNASSIHDYHTPSSQTAQHRTGIPIAALDINVQGTHAILAGKDILKTVRVQDGKVTEDFNLRSSIVSYGSTHGSQQAESVSKRRDFLPARDVRWSMGIYDHIIATAGTNGRISLYDVNAGGSRIELAWLHEHTGQVNKLDFDPYAGYVLLSASQDKTVRLWDIRDPKQVRGKLRFDVRNGVRDVRWCGSQGNNTDFAVCADGGAIQLWDVRKPLGPKLSINAHEKACYSIDWHPDGRHVISGGVDRWVKIWDFQSDNRRQKPVFQFRTPQAIRNIRWRPPCHSAELSQSGDYQSTQIATSYHHDDPRIHIWDLRRPCLPFRELDRYNSCANDLLWATKDLLWTVGDEGMFTQTDVTFAPQVHKQITPCALDWMPNGESGMFFEERGYRRPSGLEDPAVGFLSVPQEKLSSGEGGAASRSLTDEDDNDFDSPIAGGFRRQSRITSSRSAKSQANTPPTAENKLPVVPLDKAVFQRSDLFNNYQVGAVGPFPGIAEDCGMIEFLSSSYAPVATEAERMKSPDTILKRLETSFMQNADACDDVSLHRMAQSWRILAAVIVPELRDWADKNRAARRLEAAKRTEKRESTHSLLQGMKHSPLTKLTSRGVDGKLDAKAQKGIGSLFKGIVGVDRSSTTSDRDSSNMTTPQVRPLPDSPQPVRKDFGSPAAGDTIDSIQPLPQSLLISHSTAAAAADALFDGSSNTPNTPPSPPEQYKHSKRTPLKDKRGSQDSLRKADGKTKPLQTQKDLPGPKAQQSRVPQAQKQEERRAALRDYRAQARPIFTLEEPVSSPMYRRIERDSAGEFSMFSASTDSSHKERSLGQSFESPKGRSKSSETDDLWQNRKDSDVLVPSSPPSDDSVRERRFLAQHAMMNNKFSSGDVLPNFGIDGTTDFSFGLDGSSGSGEQRLSRHREDSWDLIEAASTHTRHNEAAISTSPPIFQFDTIHSPPQTQIHPFNPVLDALDDSTRKALHDADIGPPSVELAEHEMAADEYIFKDFRPIDFSKYESRLPFAWSSLPLICQFVAFDLDNGNAHAQFATHLLMHVSPFFFHKDFRNKKFPCEARPESVAERLLRPDLSHRVIESIFLLHTSYLRQTHLFGSLAELRKMSMELGYPKVVTFAREPAKGSTLSNSDPNLVTAACTHCGSPIHNAVDACQRCRKLRPVCPICLTLDHPSGHTVAILGKEANGKPCVGLWVVCQACGHGAHSSCMQEWLSHLYSDGACPTEGCGCDCGPGIVRKQRVHQQSMSLEEGKLIRGGGQASAKKDSLRVAPSPAVDKTRAVLRAGRGERVTHSGDEREMTRRATSGSRIDPGWQRKSVRLVTPGEENRRRPGETRRE